jgi:hypothetical protein
MSDQTAEDISRLILKLERFETILTAKVETFTESIHTISKSVQEITERTNALSIEVEELRDVRNSLVQKVQKATEEGIVALEPSLSNKISQSFKCQTGDFITHHLETLKTIQQETDRTTSSLQSMIEGSKRRVRVMGLWTALVVCSACFGMAYGFFHFFPQHHYVRYETGAEQGKQLIYGKALMDTFKKLTPDDQLILKAAVETLIKKPTF